MITEYTLSSCPKGGNGVRKGKGAAKWIVYPPRGKQFPPLSYGVFPFSGWALRGASSWTPVSTVYCRKITDHYGNAECEIRNNWAQARVGSGSGFGLCTPRIKDPRPSQERRATETGMWRNDRWDSPAWDLKFWDWGIWDLGLRIWEWRLACPLLTAPPK